jgi:hypothetical protein
MKNALFQAFNMRQKTTMRNRAKNRRTSKNTGRNPLCTPKVLNNSPTTIPSRHRKNRHFAPPSCATIQSQNTQQFEQENHSLFQSLVPKLQFRNGPGAPNSSLRTPAAAAKPKIRPSFRNSSFGTGPAPQTPVCVRPLRQQN